MEDPGLKPSADIASILMIDTPAPSVVPPPSAEIHTIATGHLIDHDRASTCWCHPSQDAGDPRIWHHNGHNDEHHPMYQTDENGAAIVVNGYLVPTLNLRCGCGRLMPKGRTGHCLPCHRKHFATE